MNDQEKIAQARVGRHLRRTGIAIRRALRDYFRNLSGSAVRRNDAYLGGLKSRSSELSGRLRSTLEDLATRTNIGNEMSELAQRISGATSTGDALRKARRAARVNTAVYGGGTAGGIGLGTLLSLNGDQEKKSEAYLRGFAEKCAEYGLDADVSMALLEKEAFKVKVPGKAAIREGAKRVGDSLRTYWGHLSGKTARRAGEAKDAVGKNLEQARNEVRRHHTRENVRREVELLYQDAEAAKAFRKAKHTRNVVRGRTAAGVAVAGGGGGVVAATRGGRKGGQEKKSSHDPGMRKVAEVLAAFVEGMECRR